MLTQYNLLIKNKIGADDHQPTERKLDAYLLRSLFLQFKTIHIRGSHSSVHLNEAIRIAFKRLTVHLALK